MVMPDHVYRATLSFPKKSGIPADKVDWDFHFRHAAGVPTATNFDNLADALQNFVNTTSGAGTASVVSKLSASLSTATDGVEVNFYLLPAAPGASGPPAAVRAFTLGTTSTTSLPDECAICLSYEADVAGVPEFSGSTRPRARRRNRTYIGPLGDNVSILDSTTKEFLIQDAVMVDWTESARDFLFALPAVDGWSWEAVSKTEWTSRAVFDVWCDNAIDIQRRRGETATKRTFVVL